MAEARICPICGKEFEIKVKQGGRKYCSRGCSEEANRRHLARRQQLERQQKEKRQGAAGRTKTRSPLAEMARKARAAGMTYGQYAALEYAKRQS